MNNIEHEIEILFSWIIILIIHMKNEKIKTICKRYDVPL